MMELANVRREIGELKSEVQMLGQWIEPDESAFHLVKMKTEAEFWENENKLRSPE